MSRFDEDSLTRMISGNVLEYVIKDTLGGLFYHTILRAYPCLTRSIEIDGVKYLDDRFITLVSEPTVCAELPKDYLDEIIIDAINTITAAGKLVDIPSNDEYVYNFVNRNEDHEYVKDIEVLPFNGQMDLSDETIQKLCIEKPVRNACKYLTSNGINTIMSSANKYNVESKDEPVDENKLYIGKNDRWVIGNGYAWIMLEWNALSRANKQYFIEAVKNNDDSVKLYEYIDVSKETALEYDYDHSKMIEGLNIIYQSGDKDYDDNKVILFGNNSLNNYDLNVEHSRFKTVVLRYPVNENTTVKEVEDYFMKLGEKIVNNNKEDKIKQIVELAFREITKKGYFDIEKGNAPIPGVWNAAMSTIPNAMTDYVNDCGYGCCFVFSAYMMAILNRYGINSYMIGTKEDTGTRASVMYEDNGVFYVANPVEDIEYFTKHNIKPEDRDSYYDDNSATMNIDGNKHNDSRYTLDEFCKKYGTIWVIGSMSDKSQETLSNQFSTMPSRTIMPPERANYDVKKLLYQNSNK